LFVYLCATKFDWLATIEDDCENLELIRLKWRTFMSSIKNKWWTPTFSSYDIVYL